MIVVHACTTIIVHACTMIIIHICTMIIVHVCTRTIVNACTMMVAHAWSMIIVHVSWSAGLMLRAIWGSQAPNVSPPQHNKICIIMWVMLWSEWETGWFCQNTGYDHTILCLSASIYPSNTLGREGFCFSQFANNKSKVGRRTEFRQTLEDGSP